MGILTRAVIEKKDDDFLISLWASNPQMGIVTEDAGWMNTCTRMHAAVRNNSQNATQPSSPAPSATTSATLEAPPSPKAAPSDAVVVADADADAPVPVPVPVPPEMPVGSLGCSAVVVVDSELRLLSVVDSDPVAVVLAVVSVTGVDVKVRIGPPGLVLLTEKESESVVSGSETAATAAEGPRRRGRV